MRSSITAKHPRTADATPRSDPTALIGKRLFGCCSRTPPPPLHHSSLCGCSSVRWYEPSCTSSERTCGLLGRKSVRWSRLPFTRGAWPRRAPRSPEPAPNRPPSPAVCDRPPSIRSERPPKPSAGSPPPVPPPHPPRSARWRPDPSTRTPPTCPTNPPVWCGACSPSPACCSRCCCSWWQSSPPAHCGGEKECCKAGRCCPPPRVPAMSGALTCELGTTSARVPPPPRPRI